MPENKRKKTRVQNKAKAKTRKMKTEAKKALDSLTPAQRKILTDRIKKNKPIRQNEDWLKKSKKHKEKNYA